MLRLWIFGSTGQNNAVPRINIPTSRFGSRLRLIIRIISATEPEARDEYKCKGEYTLTRESALPISSTTLWL